MLKPLPEPLVRSPLRMALGKAWFITKRRVSWHMSSRAYATNRSVVDLAYLWSKTMPS